MSDLKHKDDVFDFDAMFALMAGIDDAFVEYDADESDAFVESDDTKDAALNEELDFSVQNKLCVKGKQNGKGKLCTKRRVFQTVAKRVTNKSRAANARMRDLKRSRARASKA